MKKQKFSFRCIAYQEKDGSFTGVCLDLDIVEERHQTLEESILSLNDAILSHLRAASRLGFPEELISRPAPKEYWNKVKEIVNPKLEKKASTSFQIYSVSSDPTSRTVYA